MNSVMNVNCERQKNEGDKNNREQTADDTKKSFESNISQNIKKTKFHLQNVVKMEIIMRVQKHFCLLVGVIHGKILFQLVKT